MVQQPLPSGEILGIFIYFYAINKEFALSAHIHASSGITKLPVFFSSSNILNKVRGLERHSFVSSCSNIECTSDS